MMEKSWKFGGLKFGVVEVSVVVVDDDDVIVVVVVVVRGSLCCIHLVLSLPLKNGMPNQLLLVPSHSPLLLLSNFTTTPITRQLPSH